MIEAPDKWSQKLDEDLVNIKSEEMSQIMHS